MRIFLCAATLATLCVSRANAQSTLQDGLAGMRLAAGGGSGALKLTCNCFSSGHHEPSNSSRVWMAEIGFKNSPQTIIGVEYDNWARNDQLRTPTGTLYTRTTTVTWLDLTAHWYPVTHGPLAGLYVKGAIGVTTMQMDPGLPLLRSIGGGGGLGYELHLTKLLSVMPYYDVLAAQQAERPGSTQHIGAFMSAYGLALRFNGLP